MKKREYNTFFFSFKLLIEITYNKRNITFRDNYMDLLKGKNNFNMAPGA